MELADKSLSASVDDRQYRPSRNKDVEMPVNALRAVDKVEGYKVMEVRRLTFNLRTPNFGHWPSIRLRGGAGETINNG